MRRLFRIVFCLIVSCGFLFSCARHHRSLNTAVSQTVKPSEKVIQLAHQNNGFAQLMLATMYQQGLASLQKDDWQYMGWLQKAADNEIAYAQYLLAVHYQQGNLLPRNIDLAMYWYEKSASHGFSLAQQNLAIYYGIEYLGNEYRKHYNPSKAYFWSLLVPLTKSDYPFSLYETLVILDDTEPDEKKIVALVASMENIEAHLDKLRYALIPDDLSSLIKSRLSTAEISDINDAARKWQPTPQRTL